MSDAGRTLDRWDYLTTPLRSLLLTLRVELRETAAPELGFQGAIRRSTSASWWGWVLWMPIGQDPLERDLVARGLLAAAHGVDVSDWPTPMEIRET